MKNPYALLRRDRNGVAPDSEKIDTAIFPATFCCENHCEVILAKVEKLPYMKWYPADLDAEPTLRFCGWDSCWLWVKMLGFMHHSPQRGFLIKQNGQAYTESDLVIAISGATPERVRDCLFELETNAVFSRDRRGIIYNRKMVKGEKRAQNIRPKKTKPEDKSEINPSKIGDKSDLAPPASTGCIKENITSGDRSVSKPESRVQSLERKKEEKNILKKENLKKPDDLSDQTWGDFLSLRKVKKAPVTETVISRIRQEAHKIGWTLEQALEETCARGWQGFKAEYVQNQSTSATGGRHVPARRPTRSEEYDRVTREIYDEIDRGLIG